MTAAVAIGGLIVVFCTVVGLILQVRKQVAEQTAARRAAAAELRRKTLVEGYQKRSSEARLVIDRVVDLLGDILGHSAAVDRQLNRAISILTGAREGEPDDITSA